MKRSNKPPKDVPINSSKEDVLGRATIAHDFAKNIRRLDASEGIVVGVLGGWGSGKSSFVNLMREEFHNNPKLTVVDFNPWMFSGTPQLIEVFFKEVSSELRIKDKTKFGTIADSLLDYSDAFSPVAMVPVVGTYFDRSVKSLKAMRKWWKERTVTPLRNKVTSALLELKNPVVVVIDDIDRLSRNEIRDIFKLVRLTASFPNIIYILAFDRKRVEAALDEDKVPGRQYLEKIVQLSFDLPTMPNELLRDEVFKKLDIVLDGVDNIRFSHKDWPKVYFEVIEPLITNLRDVTRLALSAQLAIDTLGTEVETVDVLALEAIRVFRPELFEELQKMRTTLTDVSEPSYHDSEDEARKLEMGKLIELSGKDSAIIDNLISYVFPAARRYTSNVHYGYDSLSDWKKEHRVAHIDYLNMYLDRVAPNGLVAFRRSEKAFSLIGVPAGLGDYLDSLNPDELETTIAGLEAYEGVFPAETTVPVCIALLNRIYAIPNREPKNIFDIVRPDMVVDRVVLRILRAVKEEPAREAAVREILLGIISYSSQLELIKLVGYDEGSGHKLVSKRCWELLEKEFFATVSKKQSKVPRQEWGFLNVYSKQANKLGKNFKPIAIRSVDEIRSMFTSALSVAMSETSQGVNREQRLWWDGLLRVFGDEDKIKKSLDKLRKTDGNTSLVALVSKYLDGWRPKKIGQD
jgi:hypothetical protein